MERKGMVVVLILTILLTGCTTLQPMADNAESLRNGLRSSEVVRPGDKVSVVTRDGVTRLLIVTELDQDILKGQPIGAELDTETISIPIDDIVYMDGKKFSAAKTGGVVVGTGVGLFLVIGALIAAFMVPMAY